MISEVRSFDQGVEYVRSFETPMPATKEELQTWFESVLRIVHEEKFDFERVEYYFFTADGQSWLDPDNDVLWTRGSEIKSALDKGYSRGGTILRAMDLRTNQERRRATGVASGADPEEVMRKGQELWPTWPDYFQWSEELRKQVARVVVKFPAASEPLPPC